MNHYPFLCHPERTRISYRTALTSATYVVLFEENHMQLTEAATLNRKPGEAEGSAVSVSWKRGIDAQTELTPRLPRFLLGHYVSATPKC
jgi:hypothetical protein